VIDVHPSSVETVEVSFVLPCLNEANSLGDCIREIQSCITEHSLSGEIIVADNGSTDGSQEIARTLGVRVIDVAERGYGCAIAAGVLAARGRYIIMGDSDYSYDFSQSPAILDLLRRGDDLVMGNRFKGGIEPGAMPLLHRYLGNPLLSFIGRTVFRVPVGDLYCGLRGFTREAFLRMDTRAAGMDFALELPIKARLRSMRISEVPVRLRRDRRGRPPHLQSFRDGWRGLRFMLTLSPRWTLIYPGIALLALGLFLIALVAAGPVRIGGSGGPGPEGAGGVRLDLHTLVGACLMVLVGYQTVLTGIAMRLYTLAEELGRVPDFLSRVRSVISLERGLITGALAIVLGVGAIAVPLAQWVQSDFVGPLHEARTLRYMILGSTLVAIGVQTVLASFVIGMFEVRFRRR
jgi:hypothetical protein